MRSPQMAMSVVVDAAGDDVEEADVLDDQVGGLGAAPLADRPGESSLCRSMAYPSPIAISEALPPTAAVLMETTCSSANRAR